MSRKYYDPETGIVDYKAIEKAVGYKLDEGEREYAYFFYERGGKGIPDFGSEIHLELMQYLQEEELEP